MEQINLFIRVFVWKQEKMWRTQLICFFVMRSYKPKIQSRFKA